MSAKFNTLFGGKKITIQFRPPEGEETVKTEEFFVRQLQIENYPDVMPHIGNEVMLISKACEKNPEWLKSLTPESYEVLVAAVQEVNAKGFFTSAKRRLREYTDSLKDLPPEMLQAIQAQIKKAVEDEMKKTAQA